MSGLRYLVRRGDDSYYAHSPIIVNYICFCFYRVKKKPLGESCYLVGATSTTQPGAEVAQLLPCKDRVTQFYKLLLPDNTMLFSKKYSRVKARNSFTICFGDNSTEFGEILHFKLLDRVTPFAVVTILEQVSSCQEMFSLTHDVLNSQLFPIVSSNRLMLVPINKRKMCICKCWCRTIRCKVCF